MSSIMISDELRKIKLKFLISNTITLYLQNDTYLSLLKELFYALKKDYPDQVKNINKLWSICNGDPYDDDYIGHTIKCSFSDRISNFKKALSEINSCYFLEAFYYCLDPTPLKEQKKPDHKMNEVISHLREIEKSLQRLYTKF